MPPLCKLHVSPEYKTSSSSPYGVIFRSQAIRRTPQNLVFCGVLGVDAPFGPLRARWMTGRESRRRIRLVFLEGGFESRRGPVHSNAGIEPSTWHSHRSCLAIPRGPHRLHTTAAVCIGTERLGQTTKRFFPFPRLRQIAYARSIFSATSLNSFRSIKDQHHNAGHPKQRKVSWSEPTMHPTFLRCGKTKTPGRNPVADFALQLCSHLLLRTHVNS